MAASIEFPNEEMLAELMAVVGMANQANALANGFQVEVDSAFGAGGLTTS